MASFLSHAPGHGWHVRIFEDGVRDGLKRRRVGGRIYLSPFLGGQDEAVTFLRGYGVGFALSWLAKQEPDDRAAWRQRLRREG